MEMPIVDLSDRNEVPDLEVTAIMRIADALEKLDDDQRRRVLLWASERWS